MKKIIVTYTMKKPETTKETAETCIVLSVSDAVAKLLDKRMESGSKMLERALEPIANLQGYVLDKLEMIEPAEEAEEHEAN